MVLCDSSSILAAIVQGPGEFSDVTSGIGVKVSFLVPYFWMMMYFTFPDAPWGFQWKPRPSIGHPRGVLGSQNLDV